MSDPTQPDPPAPDANDVDRDRPRRVRPQRPTAPSPAQSAQPSRATPPFFARTSTRRTIIPILLTLSLMLPALAVGSLALPSDSPLKLGGAMIALLVTAGVLTGGVAALNMLAVRRDLAPASPAAPPR